MERWYWVELIGFDADAEDFGTEAFLSRNVSTTGVSLLFAHADFLFEQQDEVLSPTACSYGGHEYNRERRRQQWTKAKLRGLVAALQARGVKVFFSCFDMVEHITDTRYLCYTASGEPAPLLCVLKNAEGVDVGREVIDRIALVLEEYGFDGLQLGDGLSSNRFSLENGDFSLSFCARSGIDIPQRLMKKDAESYRARRAWILKNARLAWIKYHADCWARFYEMLFDRVKKPIFFNNAWTRDSFEALYRYGIDYRRCCTDRAFGVMVEENSATRAITAAEDEGGVEFPLSHRDTFAYEYTLMQQDIKLVTNGLQQISLMPISDTQEQWDALRHCPTELIRATVRRYNTFVYRNGGFEVCCNAPHYCLSDGIPKSDWEWLAAIEAIRIPTPDFIDGFAAVCNPDALEADVAQFCQHKSYYGSALLGELIQNGLNLGTQLSLADAADFDRAKCLVVTNLNAYTKAQKAMLAKARLPILAIGSDVELPLEKSASYVGRCISVALYGANVTLDQALLAKLERTLRRGKLQNGEIWTEPLQFSRIAPAFFRALCRVLNEAFGLDFCEQTDVKLTSYRCGTERYILLSNDRHTYYLPTVTAAADIRRADALMKDCGYRVRVWDNRFCVRIPPRCVEIVRITDQGPLPRA